jgi:hypothetical protein
MHNNALSQYAQINAKIMPKYTQKRSKDYESHEYQWEHMCL